MFLFKEKRELLNSNWALMFPKQTPEYNHGTIHKHDINCRSYCNFYMSTGTTMYSVRQYCSVQLSLMRFDKKEDTFCFETSHRIPKTLKIIQRNEIFFILHLGAHIFIASVPSEDILRNRICICLMPDYITRLETPYIAALFGKPFVRYIIFWRYVEDSLKTKVNAIRKLKTNEFNLWTSFPGGYHIGATAICTYNACSGMFDARIFPEGEFPDTHLCGCTCMHGVMHTCGFCISCASYSERCKSSPSAHMLTTCTMDETFNATTVTAQPADRYVITTKRLRGSTDIGK